MNTVADGTYEGHEQEWNELLRALHLGPIYVPAIQAVIGEGRWKNQPNPVAYVRKGAVRCAVRMGIVDIRPNRDREILACELQYRDEDGEQLGHDDKLGMALREFEDKFGTGYDLERYSLEDRIPGVLKGEDLEVNWDRAAELAEMDAGERMVLDLRLIGFEREGALAACSTEEERRFLQAAWRRFHRHKGALSAVLESGESHRARRIQGEPQAEMELIFLETQDGGLKISFRKLVPES